MSSRPERIIGLGTAVILAIVVGGTLTLLRRGEEAAWSAARTTIERSAQAVENALDRQLLQVDGALASLPTLLAVTGTAIRSPEAAQLLRGLNFQTLAFRDLMLVDAEGTVLTSTRLRGRGRTLPVRAGLFGARPTILVGPVRNTVTGDWSLYIARTVPAWGGVTAVAEVPLLTLMKLMAETGPQPRCRHLPRAAGRTAHRLAAA